MRLLNDNAHYGIVTKSLHWLIAISMFGLIGLGWYMVDLSYYDRWYNASLSLHRSFGVLVFILGFCMLLWKWISPSPQLDIQIPAWQKHAAKLVQRILLLLVLAIPLTGFLVSTSAGKPVDVFGWFEVPVLIQLGGAWRERVIDAHYYLSYAVGGIALGHALAALKHQFINRDGTLMRMLWR